MNKVPEEVIDRLLSTSDIVDVISEYIQLTKKGRNFLVYVHFMEKIRRHFLFHKRNRFFTVLVVEKEAMHSVF